MPRITAFFICAGQQFGTGFSFFFVCHKFSNNNSSRSVVSTRYKKQKSEMANLSMDSCGSKCLKYFLAVFNLVFFLGGLLLAGFAGYEAFNPSSLINQMATNLHAPVLKDGLYILMAVGLFLAMISFFGCWGALGENRCLLITYLTFVLLIFILQLAGIIISLVKYKQIKETMIKELNSNNTQIAKTYRTAVTLMEEKFHCCGITGPDNYVVIPPSCYSHSLKRRSVTATEGSGLDASNTAATSPGSATFSPSTASELVPASAPSDTTEGATSTTSTGVLYEDGCESVIRPYLYAAGGVAIGILLIEVMVMIFTCCLISAIQKGYEVV